MITITTAPTRYAMFSDPYVLFRLNINISQVIKSTCLDNKMNVYPSSCFKIIIKHNTSMHITTFSVIEIINVHEHGVKVISGYDLKFEEKNS